MGAMGHFMLILAYQRAPAATLTPYLYGQIGFAMLGGCWCSPTSPTAWSLGGIVTIAVCGAAGAWLSVLRPGGAAAGSLKPPWPSTSSSTPENPQLRLLNQAARAVIAGGGVVAVPTDSSYAWPATWTTRRRRTACGRSATSTRSTTSPCCAGT